MLFSLYGLIFDFDLRIIASMAFSSNDLLHTETKTNRQFYFYFAYPLLIYFITKGQYTIHALPEFALLLFNTKHAIVNIINIYKQQGNSIIFSRLECGPTKDRLTDDTPVIILKKLLNRDQFGLVFRDPDSLESDNFRPQPDP